MIIAMKEMKTIFIVLVEMVTSDVALICISAFLLSDLLRLDLVKALRRE